MNKYYAFLLCVLVSFGIWAVHSLSQPCSDVVSMQVIARSNIDSRSQLSTSPVAVTARCRATGLQFLRMERRARKPVTVSFDPISFVQTDDSEFALKPSELYRYSAFIFGDRVTVENLLSQEMVFRFAPENSRKVPVVPVQTIACRQQFMQLGPMRMQPDSVFIFGDPKIVDGIERVLTKPVSLNDVHSNVDGTVKLERMHGVRYSVNEARYSLSVSRYVEIAFEAPVKVRNLPAGHNFSIYPSSVSVACHCIFPMKDNPEQKISFYVDYQEFETSVSGKCIVHMDGECEGLIGCSIQPQTCDCLEIVN